MGEFKIGIDELDTAHYYDEKITDLVYQELAERGIHKDRLSDWSVKVVVTVYYDIERR